MNISNFQTYEDWYLDEMERYAEEAYRKFYIYLDSSDVKAFTYCVAFSFCEDVLHAINLFNERGLKKIHAYAVLKNFDWFQEELDEILQEKYESRFD